MTDSDLQSAAARIHDELLDIARMFADAEHYKAALHAIGFARLIVEEASGVQQKTPAKLRTCPSLNSNRTPCS